MANSVEDLVNQALVAIGHPDRIAWIFDGSPAAIASLEIYGQTRDELMDAGEWPLARRANVPLTLLKGPPPRGGFSPRTPWSARYPPPGWLYEYAYPSDMLNLKSVIRPPMAMFNLMPRPAVWRVDNDNSLIDNNGAPTVQKKVILTNTAGALATYIGQVTDPTLWEPGFIKIIIDRLAEKLSRRLMKGEDVKRDQIAEMMSDLPMADQDRG